MLESVYRIDSGLPTSGFMLTWLWSVSRKKYEHNSFFLSVFYWHVLSLILKYFTHWLIQSVLSCSYWINNLVLGVAEVSIVGDHMCYVPHKKVGLFISQKALEDPADHFYLVIVWSFALCFFIGQMIIYCWFLWF